MSSAFQFLVPVLINLVHVSQSSITGVTYMDDFDFEERYRDVYECNPMYWYPLHMPEKCMPAFDQLLRASIPSITPLRVMMEKEPIEMYHPTAYQEEYEYYEEHPLSPLETLFELLSRDIQNHPRAPTLENDPYLGAVAKYRQPVSSQSNNMIKKLSKAYAHSMSYQPFYSFKFPESNSNKRPEKLRSKMKILKNKRNKFKAIAVCILLIVTMKRANCSVAGLTYMDRMQLPPTKRAGEDPCNPLYWYPRNIPEYCYKENSKASSPLTPKFTIPPPAPDPVPLMPFMPSFPGYPLPIPFPMYPPPAPQMNMVPGLPGLVSRDGGINLMPFSDVYADMLEKHKNKVIRRKLRKELKKFEKYRTPKRYSRLRKYRFFEE